MFPTPFYEGTRKGLTVLYSNFDFSSSYVSSFIIINLNDSELGREVLIWSQLCSRLKTTNWSPRAINLPTPLTQRIAENHMFLLYLVWETKILMAFTTQEIFWRRHKPLISLKEDFYKGRRHSHWTLKVYTGSGPWGHWPSGHRKCKTNAVINLSI